MVKDDISFVNEVSVYSISYRSIIQHAHVLVLSIIYKHLYSWFPIKSSSVDKLSDTESLGQNPVTKISTTIFTAAEYPSNLLFVNIIIYIHCICVSHLQVLCVMLAVASSEYLCELQEDEFVISQNDLPNISIPFLHIVREEMKEIIYFVKEAISGGFYFHKNHLIYLDNSLSNPKTYSTLRHLDFDLFESIIQRCWEDVVIYLKNPESFKYIDSVKRTRYLIVENMFLFHTDFSNELIHLR